MGFVKVDKAYGYFERCIQFLQFFFFLCYLISYLGILTYPHSSDYRPDIDALPPVQVGIFCLINYCLMILNQFAGHCTGYNSGHWSFDIKDPLHLSDVIFQNMQPCLSWLRLMYNLTQEAKLHKNESFTSRYQKKNNANSCFWGWRPMWGFTSIFQLSLFYLLFFYLIIIIFFGIELIDYDFSSSLQHPCIPQARMNRTGAIPFMAIGLLNDKYWNGSIERLYWHELGAFIWILSFVFLRYQNGKS